MNVRKFISGHFGPTVIAVFIVLLVSAAAQGRSNPVDPISNPNDLEYSDVKMRVPKYDEPFQRDGVVSKPEVFKQISAGMQGSAVENLIGKSLNQTNGSSGVEWNYNFKFVLPNSQNYLVCQYKVVLDGAQQVLETVWRRHQCSDIVTTALAG